MKTSWSFFLSLSILCHILVLLPISLKQPIATKKVTVQYQPLKLKLQSSGYRKSVYQASEKGKYGPPTKKINSLKDLSIGADSSFSEPHKSNLEAKTQSFSESLNPKEQVYYSYFHRIKIKLDNVWQLKVRDEIARLISEGRLVLDDKITQVIITLNHQGQLEKVQILRPSGVQDLDSTAVLAFKLAEPFPNPPQGLIEEDNKVRITWSFIVDF